MTGFTKEQADRRRSEYHQAIHACWWCLAESSPGPYYFAVSLSFVDHRLACPDHFARIRGFEYG